MTLIEEIKERAKADKKTIVLPEAMDTRVLKAAEKILEEEMAEIILVGDEEEIKNKAKLENSHIQQAQLVNPMRDKRLEKYAKSLSEIAEMDEDEAKKMMLDPVYFGMMMVKMGDGDGLVSGAMSTTRDVLKTAMRIFEREGTKILSSVMLVVLEEKIYLFSDCALYEKPGYLALSEIAIASSKTYEKLVGQQAKVAMLSYSTHGSAQSKYTEKIVKATKRAKEKCPDLVIDGELQFDSAIVPEVAQVKAPHSSVKGAANVLIFPDINSGNISYKLVERLGKAQVFGPICQGLEKPINDLSRGSSVEDIVGTIMITAIQAQK